jgi:hypothetical protein
LSKPAADRGIEEKTAVNEGRSALVMRKANLYTVIAKYPQKIN